MWSSVFCVVILGCCLVHGAPTADPVVEEDLVTVVEHTTTQQPLPDTSAITGELTEKLGVTKFFSLWLVFNDPSQIEIQTGTEFAILAPQQSVPLKHEGDDISSLLERPKIVKRVLLDHVILGRRLRLATREDKNPFTVTTLSGRQVNVTNKEGKWYLNDALVLEPESEVSSSGELVVLDHYLFSDYEKEEEVTEEAPATTTDAPVAETSPLVTAVEVEAPQPLIATVERDPQIVSVEKDEVSVDDPLPPAVSEEPVEKHVDISNETNTEEVSEFNGDLAEELSKLPAVFNLTRVPIFNKFLKDANVSQLLEKGKQYTVLFPIDRAFQRWHPIDWGFYPFSVPEFTAEVIRSHFLKGALHHHQITDNFTAETINNRTVTFRRLPTGELTANGVAVMRRDVTLHGGTVLVVPEVLFVTHKVVQELRKHHRDQETPPLLAFPWWNAQFLSHSYLALEKNSNFTSMERLMNSAANLHLQVPGKNYSMLVPTNDAFTKAGLVVPGWWSERSVAEVLSPESMLILERMLLRHLIHGRLYMRQLTQGLIMNALDNSTHTISQKEGKTLVDDKAEILEGDVFVYNLGTMFYVDTVLGSEEELESLRKVLATQELTIPESELEEESGTGKDLLIDEAANPPQVTSTTMAPVTSSSVTNSHIETSTKQESNDIPPVEPTSAQIP